MHNPRLPLDNLSSRHPGLTQPIGDAYSEAARVCLDRHHTSPIEVRIERTASVLQATIEWVAANQKTKDAWANKNDTTEAGAYGCLLASVELSEGLVAIRRAETLTGADYYVARPGSGLEDLEQAFRLEISGVDSGGIAEVEERLQRKIVQAAHGASNLPAIAGVIGFLLRLVRIEYLR
jgi:hypothetical protein